MTDAPYRIAIVGMGPRGFGCLERLAIELARTPASRAVHVTLHDPAPHPGAGPIYDPEQPSELLMNLAARHVNAWSGDAAELVGSRGGDLEDLLDWLGRSHPDWASADAYVPRSLVGAYFEAVFDTLLDRLPAGLTVTVVPAVVTDVDLVEGRWWVRHADPALDRCVDEVICTVGHGVWPAGSAGEMDPPYPVRRAFSVDQVPPGAVVAVRGFALTFVDVALHLTVGRGGRIDGIEQLSSSDAPWPVYTPGEGDVACLIPWSRSGAPLLAKPGPELAAASAELDETWARLRMDLRTAGRDVGDPIEVIVAAIASAAETALERLGTPVDRRVRASIAALLEADPVRAAQHDLHDGPAALAAMRRSVEVALGRRPPDASWAVGEAWRQGYPGLIERVGHGGLAARARPRFAALARRLERVGFGGPLENIARMVALADAGALDLGHLRCAGVVEDDRRLALIGPAGSRPVDFVVDSVLAPPGADHGTPVWGGLLRRGLARLAAGTSGIEVSAEAACVARDGRVTPGLAAVGRATEGWVLGNDTLNRTLHHETEGWARRVVRDLQGARAGESGELADRAHSTLSVCP